MHVLPYTHHMNPTLMTGSLGDLLCELPDCQIAEKVALFRLCAIVAHHNPKVTPTWLFKLNKHLISLAADDERIFVMDEKFLLYINAELDC
jgi:hypothetical protein